MQFQKKRFLKFMQIRKHKKLALPAMLSFQMKLDYPGNIYTKFDSYLTPVIRMEQYIPDTPAYVS